MVRFQKEHERTSNLWKGVLSCVQNPVLQLDWSLTRAVAKQRKSIEVSSEFASTLFLWGVQLCVSIFRFI